MAVGQQVNGAATVAAGRNEKPAAAVRPEDTACNNNVIVGQQHKHAVAEDEGLIVPPMGNNVRGFAKSVLKGNSGYNSGAPLSYASPCRNIGGVPYNSTGRLPEMGPIPEVSKRLPEMGPIPEVSKDVSSVTPMQPIAAATVPGAAPATSGANVFAYEETLLIVDWDDTILPSTWIHTQGLRLDDASFVSDWQREQLDEVAVVVAKTLRMAKQFGTVVFVTNAERGWIELSCQKFMPTLYPALKGVKVVSARTTYEGPQNPSPLDWKLRAFEQEIETFYGAAELKTASRRKNVLSLGDSVSEREALLRTTEILPNCHSKSLKFVERPELGQMLKQHNLVTNCFGRVVHHDGNLDLVIRCS